MKKRWTSLLSKRDGQSIDRGIGNKPTSLADHGVVGYAEAAPLDSPEANAARGVVRNSVETFHRRWCGY